MGVAGLESSLSRGPTGDRHRLAPPRLQLALEPAVASEGRSPASRCGRPTSGTGDGCGEPTLGRTSHPWGLLKLGFAVSERTVSRLMPRRRTPPSQSWRTFLTNHLGSTTAVDFFAVPTLTCRILFVFVVLAHDRRRILHVDVTQHPTSAWTRQQLREAFPNEANARFLLHDGDTTFDAAFDRTINAFGLTAVRTAPHSPWQNPYVERVIGSIRRECLDHVIVLNERHLRWILRAYVAYYHRSRTHLALDKNTPLRRAIDVAGSGRIVARPEVGGLHHRYERQAA